MTNNECAEPWAQKVRREMNLLQVAFGAMHAAGILDERHNEFISIFNKTGVTVSDFVDEFDRLCKQLSEANDNAVSADKAVKIITIALRRMSDRYAAQENEIIELMFQLDGTIERHREAVNEAYELRRERNSMRDALNESNRK